MKKIILLFFCLVQFSFSFCQDRKWLTDNAEWYYTVIADMGRYTGYVNYHNVRDTVVSGKACRVMDVSYASQQFSLDLHPDKIIAYEEEGALYYYVRNDFHILYDFTKEVGDTIKVVVETPSNDNDTIAYLIVEEVGTYVVESDTLRTQFLSAPFLGLGKNSSADSFYGWVIEGVGHLRTFLPVYLFGLSCDNACPVELRCYSDNDIDLRLVDYACDTTYMYTSTHDVLLHGSDLKISPNPVKPFGNIKLSIKGTTESESIFFEILGVNGRKIHSGTTTIKNGILVNAISPGIYFLKINLSNKVYVEKLVVQ